MSFSSFWGPTSILTRLGSAVKYLCRCECSSHAQAGPGHDYAWLQTDDIMMSKGRRRDNAERISTITFNPEAGTSALIHLTSSYFEISLPPLGVADLPFLFKPSLTKVIDLCCNTGLPFLEQLTFL